MYHLRQAVEAFCFQSLVITTDKNTMQLPTLNQKLSLALVVLHIYLVLSSMHSLPRVIHRWCEPIQITSKQCPTQGGGTGPGYTWV